MIEWLAENMGTIFVSAIIVLIVVLIIRKLIRDKKAGRHSCGGDCGGCAGCSGCCDVHDEHNHK